MRAKSPPLTDAAYSILRQVHGESLRPTEAALQLSQHHGFNRNSARHLVDAYKALRTGGPIKFGPNDQDTAFLLSRIEADEGVDAVRTALRSLWQHIRYSEGAKPGSRPGLRALASTYESRVGPPSLERLTADFNADVEQSLKDGQAARLERLKLRPRVPDTIQVTVTAFRRSADVVAEVLTRAEGLCARCNQPAPFKRRRDGAPYLEVHHKRQLALGGEDTVENAEALCPNCHRELHHGEELH